MASRVINTWNGISYPTNSCLETYKKRASHVKRTSLQRFTLVPEPLHEQLGGKALSQHVKSIHVTAQCPVFVFNQRSVFCKTVKKYIRVGQRCCQKQAVKVRFVKIKTKDKTPLKNYSSKHPKQTYGKQKSKTPNKRIYNLKYFIKQTILFIQL